jgi:HD-like signal output (HDOD) protein
MEKMSKKILFVDEEKRVLEGLKRTLFPLRKEFILVFESDFSRALTLLTKDNFEVVVTEVKPDLADGLELLKAAYKYQPQALRIVLSGYLETDLLLQTLGIAHQFLSKPVEAKKLKEVIQRGLSLRNLFEDKRILQLLGKITTLPTLPKIYQQLNQALAKKNVSPQELAEIIIQDMGLTTKILQLVNSAFFSLARKITRIEEAIVFLGINTIKSLVLGISVLEEGNKITLPNFSLEYLSGHSLKIAQTLKKLGIKEGLEPERGDELFLAGLIHDCGIVILAQNFPSQYQEVARLIAEGQELEQAEKKVFNLTHAEIGAYLLNLWGISEDIVTMVFYHHKPLQALDKILEVFLIHLAEFMDSQNLLENL